jgi:hypothetical protein
VLRDSRKLGAAVGRKPEAEEEKGFDRDPSMGRVVPSRDV